MEFALTDRSFSYLVIGPSSAGVPARYVLLYVAFLLLPVLCCGQVISLVSRSTGEEGVAGDAESGTSVTGYVQSPVTDTGSVFLLSLARLDSLLDENVVRDVYRRSGSITSVISVSEYPPDTDVFGNVAGVSVSDEENRIVTIRPGNDLDAVRQAFVWDLTGMPFVRSTFLPDSVDTAFATISGNGQFVVFVSPADGIVPDDTNGRPDVFLYSTVVQSVIWLSACPAGTAANGDSYAPSLSDNASHVVFLSKATDIVGMGSSGNAHVILHETASGKMTRIDERTDAVEAAAAESCCISGDGSRIVFASPDDGFVAGDMNGVTDVFLRSADGNDVELVSAATDGTPGNAASRAPAVNRDGRFIVFVSTATNLSGTDTYGKQQIYLRDRSSGATLLISQSSTGDAADADCFVPAISPSGRYVTFVSAATTLGSAGPISVPQVFLVDRGDAYLNHPPDAAELTVSTPKNTPVSVQLEGSDSDSDSEELTFTVAALPVNGKLYDGDVPQETAEITTAGHVIQNSEQRITYLPAAEFVGTDAFTYRVSDPHGASDLASVTISTTVPEDHPPQLALNSERFVMAAGTAEGMFSQELFEVTDPDDPNGPGPDEIWIEILSEPVNGVLLDKNGVAQHEGDSVLLADFSLTYQAYSPEEFSSESISFRAYGDDWMSDSVALDVVVGAVLQTLSFCKGWNLISFKMDPLDPDPDVMFTDGGSIRISGTIWFWNTETHEYEQALALVGGCGYWIYTGEETFGMADIPGSPIINTLLPVYQGWNLVGPVGTGTECSLPNPVDGFREWIWYWDCLLQNYQLAEYLFEGLGYWINAEKDSAVDLRME